MPGPTRQGAVVISMGKGVDARMPITSFEELLKTVQQGEAKRLAVAAAQGKTAAPYVIPMAARNSRLSGLNVDPKRLRSLICLLLQD